MEAAECVLCRRLVNRDSLAPGEAVWEFPHSVAFLGPWQFYHGYCVLISRIHASELFQLSDAERRAHLDEMCLLAQAIHDAVRPRKLNYELLGNQVPHLHWHIFPRSADDPETLQAVWLALDRAERDPALRRRNETGPCDRAATTAMIRQHLQTLGAPTP